ncbi:MAG: hypothetical protein QF685_04500 [Verrucomicrobiota bacterium]|jgi:hypothetical protein|nr:hypothetical protein [Verrucomicrobiota bacterium]
MMRWISIPALLLPAIFTGCESNSQSSTYSMWDDSSFRSSSWYDYGLHPSSITIPNKPTNQMNEEELRQTTRAINWINRVNRGYTPFPYDHFRQRRIWIHEP